ncbi:MAG TPA: hypothetical protein VF254_01795 [Gammaproteobacteria bacterium]
MKPDDLPEFWWLPGLILACGAFFYRAMLESAGARNADVRSLRTYFLIFGICLLYIGAILLYFAPVGGRIHSTTEARIFGGLFLLAGWATLGSFGNESEVRRAFEREERSGYLQPDPDKYVSPRERVLGEIPEEKRAKKPWE